MGTPWERMQLENLTASCCIWAWVGWLLEREALGELGEFEPQAAIAVAAVIAPAANGSLEVGRYMTHVVSSGRSHQCNTPALTGEH